MRQQQNRRNKGRKIQNPLSRNYESNGPAGKIRGNAQVIYEKYTSMAQDALAAGDRISSESFFQYAEHYRRIIVEGTNERNNEREEQNRDQYAQQKRENHPKVASTIEDLKESSEESSTNQDDEQNNLLDEEQEILESNKEIKKPIRRRQIKPKNEIEEIKDESDKIKVKSAKRRTLRVRKTADQENEQNQIAN